MNQIKPHPVPLQRFEHTPVGWRLTVSVHCGKDRDGDTMESVCRRGIAALEDVIHSMREALAELEGEQQPGGDA
ncbi:hypothetical protein H3222_11710 [Pseudomonas chengduensis]|jgi:hypothetical protein|nr:hypothetical protein [Pseudomonas chengduensis]MBG0845877.1 hypothetical protein [Pseudomonas chengduensis]